MKNFKEKAIYNPSGKAGEYSKWACNFYVGCSIDCEYCYCKKGILAGGMKLFFGFKDLMKEVLRYYADNNVAITCLKNSPKYERYCNM